MADKATVGRILHYTIKSGDLAGDRMVGEARPAIVVKVWPNEYPAENKTTDGNGHALVGDGYNVQVLLDGTNDTAAIGQACLWRTSLAICDEPTPGHLSWPPRV
jgi:hypothetical protein